MIKKISCAKKGVKYPPYTIMIASLVFFCIVCGLGLTHSTNAYSAEIATPEEMPNINLQTLNFNNAVRQVISKLANGDKIAFAGITNSSSKKSKFANEIFLIIEPIALAIGSSVGVEFVERQDLQLIMEEWKLNMSGLVSQDAGAQSLLGADFLLTGKVSIDNSKVRCTLKIISLSDGKIIGIATGWQDAKPVYFKWVAAAESATQDSNNNSNMAVSKDKQLQLWTDAPSYEIGDPMRLFFEVTKPLYVKIIDVTPAGEVTIIFPNPYQPESFCKPGVRYQIPPKGADFSLEVTPPIGNDRIKAIASSDPISVTPEAKTRGIKFTKQIIKAAPTRASIIFSIM